MGYAEVRNVNHRAYKRTIPARIFKSIVNCILLIPYLFYMVARDSYKKNVYINNVFD